MKRILSAALALCMILVMLPVAVHAESLNISSFAELKEAAGQNRSEYVKICYENEEPLVIEEDLFLDHSVSLESYAPVIVSEGVTLTVAKALHAQSLTVKGELMTGDRACLTIEDSLTVTGIIRLNGVLKIVPDTVVVGQENISIGQIASIECYYYVYGDPDDLDDTFAQVEEKWATHPDWLHVVDVVVEGEDLTLDSDLEIPEYLNLIICNNGGALVVPENVTVTVYGSMSVRGSAVVDGTLINNGGDATAMTTLQNDLQGSFVVNGTLINNGSCTPSMLTVNGTICNNGRVNLAYFGYLPDRTMTLSDGAVYEGTGTIQLENYSYDEDYDLLNLVSSLNLDNFEVDADDYVCILRLHEHVFENGWCAICGMYQGDVLVSSFAELKEAVEQNTAEWLGIYSANDEPLVIEEDLVLDKSINAFLSAPIIVPEGVTLTVEGWLDTPYLTVDGTLTVAENAALRVGNALTVTGSVRLNGALSFGSDTTVTGLENISVGDNGHIGCRYEIAGSFEDLVAVMDQIAEKQERYPDWWFEVVHFIGADDLVLTSDLVISEGISIYFNSGGGALVVPKNVTVTAYESMSVAGPAVVDGTLITYVWFDSSMLTVNGTLRNEGWLNLQYSENQSDFGMTLCDGAVYEGQGSILLENFSGDEDFDLLSLISGLDLDGFEIYPEEYSCKLRPAHEHVFENGWCAICGISKEEMPGATSGVCGDNLTWNLDENGTLTISGTGPMYDYGVFWDEQGNEYERPTEWNRFDIKKVVIEPGVTTVGSRAFEGTINMTELVLPEGITYIGDVAFMSAPITTLDIPDSVVSIGLGAFYNCSSLTGEVTLPAGLEELAGNAFSGCSGITGWKIADSNKHFKVQDGVLYNADMTRLMNYPASRPGAEFTVPDSVDTIGIMALWGARNLQTITLGKGVKTIGENSIGDVQNLKAVEVSADNLHYTAVDGVLFNKAKTRLVFYPVARETPDGTYHVPEGVQEIGAMAFLQSELQEIVLPDSVTEIAAQAMYGCRQLKRIHLGEGLQKIGYGAFADCVSLSSLVYPASLQEIGVYHLLDCEALTNIIFKGSAPTIEEGAFQTVSTTVVYPAGDATWNDSTKLGYGGELKWIASSPVLEGADAVVDPAAGHAIRVDAPVAEFVGVTVNGEIVAPENYTVTEGSTIVTFKPEYLATLEEGVYTVVISFTDAVAVADMTVSDGTPAALPGDVDGSGVVDQDDAIYLLFHVFFGEGSYPVSQTCDYNGDGTVNQDDAIYLLFHAFFGADLYPLN